MSTGVPTVEVITQIEVSVTVTVLQNCITRLKKKMVAYIKVSLWTIILRDNVIPIDVLRSSYHHRNSNNVVITIT